MALMVWNDKFSVGVKELDDHHKTLVALVNELHDAMKVGKTKEIMDDILARLTDYTRFHFSAEEKYMTKYSYPQYTQHKLEHDKFTEKVLQFQKDLKDGKFAISMEIMTFLKDWLINHISGSDKKYGPFFNEHGLK
ncbi:hemerythrin-like metal-binding protein [Thermincola ferriacetica]|uniref:Hemerythrin-like metal-binding protein n=1 Tax=Thermincola ferriacetica TaxID=281456 RepID=A0A0L6W2Q7_9FIRM|nr:bacteriohemerythrin [Thermincola ferriacetica]KNZ69825.1 hemerythrin-like metal-binding protein [Thermincola ferriacetica]